MKRFLNHHSPVAAGALRLIGQRALLLLALCLTVYGCGIDRGGAPIVTTLGPGVPAAPGEKATVGAIDSIGADSIRINETDIDVAAATLTVNGASADLSMLRVGHYAVTRTREDNGAVSALSVAVDVNVDGPVGAYDATANSLTVLGQTVAIVPTTRFDVSLAGLDLADRTAVPNVVVSGYTAADGSIRATRLGLGSGQDARLTGFASSVLPTQFSFSIGGLAIDFSSPLMLALTLAEPVENERLTVTGPAPASGTPLLAATVTSAPLIDAALPFGSEVSLTGLVTRFAAANDFDVAFTPAALDVNALTTGGTAADLASGSLVRAHGTLQPGGLFITELVFLP